MDAEKPVNNMATVEGSFQEYLKIVFAGIPIGAKQVEELRKAYYYGVTFYMVAVETMANSRPPREFVAWSQSIAAEINNFSHELQPNQAGPFDEEAAGSTVILPPTSH